MTDPVYAAEHWFQKYDDESFQREFKEINFNSYNVSVKSDPVLSNIGNDFLYSNYKAEKLL
jgi:hypothetical protein